MNDYLDISFTRLKARQAAAFYLELTEQDVPQDVALYLTLRYVLHIDDDALVDC